VLSLNFPFSLGNFTIFFSLLLILLQLLILRNNFKPEHLLQVPVSIVFGYFIDLCMALFKDVQPGWYITKILCLLAGCFILGIGVYMEVLADVVMLPGEAVVRAVVFRWKTEFGITKIAFDITMAVSAGVLSFCFEKRLYGVREGTIVAAVLVGFTARFIGRRLSFLQQVLFGSTEDKLEKQKKNAICIVIGRQYGSGGHDIGKLLAERLSFDFYDKYIIQMAAGSTGYTPKYISEREEKMTNSLIFDMINQMYVYSQEHTAPQDAIFEAEASVVKEASQKSNCVIVGRCADYILRERRECLKVYLYAPIEFRVKRIMETEGLSEKEARKKIQQMDRQRAEHYRYYTHQIWGMASNYQLCIDTSLGMEHTENMILEMLESIKPKEY
jgi:uncharacterized membrane protein YczE/cytidylate kinase